MTPRKNKPPRYRYQEPSSMEKLLAELGINPSPEKKESSRKSPMEQENNYKPPTVILDENDNKGDRFRIMNPIGKSINNTLQVYKAAYMALHNDTYSNLLVQDVFVSVKCINIDQEPELFNTLKAQVDKNGIIPHHKNLLQIRKPFIHENSYFCVVFPFMELGSLRSITATRFPNGLHEDLIIVALKETLNGLSVIHRNGHVHGEINAGHIFFNGKPEIKLAFSGSVFELDEDDQDRNFSSSSSLSITSICNWASAPEVYKSSNSEYYTPKADVWLIGITALELGYGGIRVDHREDFYSIVKKINKKKCLPKKEEGDNYLISKSKKKGKGILVGSCIGPVRVKNRVFSTEFEKMVVKCLDLDPEKRPTVDELLQDVIFVSLNKDLSHFHNLLKEI